MANLTKDFTFSSGGDYTFDPALIEVSGGVAQLLLGDLTGEDFYEYVDNDTDFTYDAAKTSFAVPGSLRQIQKAYRPTYYLGSFFANYDTNIDGNYGFGALTGTPTGTPVITGGKLDLTSGGSYVAYNASLNADSQQFGCIRFKYTPNYNGSPASNCSLFSIHRTVLVLNNLIFMTHNNVGNILLSIYNSAGAAIIANVNLGAWAPTSGTEYEFELNWDITNGATRLFIDGTQFGATQANIGVRDSNIFLFNIGAAYNGSNPTNGFFNDVQMFSSVQHTANYVPSAYGLSDPKQPTFYAGYEEDENGDWGDGVLTGVLNGGATVSGGYLDLRGGTLKNVDYASASNFAAANKGCIRVKWVPNYSGIPASLQDIVDVSDGVSNINRLMLSHSSTTGDIIFYLATPAGVAIYASTTYGVWNPVAGTEYEFEINYDLEAGSTKLFVDGTQFGATKTDIGTFVLTGQTTLRIGSNPVLTSLADFRLNDIIIFNHPQHVTDYVPDWTGIRAYEYDGDVITCPTMTYAGIGNIQAFTAAIITDLGSPRYNINGLYWNGSAWVASSDTWATANAEADIAANIATLPASDTVVIKIITQNSIGSQQIVDELQIEYTGQIYPITNPTIIPTTAIETDEIVTFTETISAVGLDAIKYAVKINGTNYYHNGSAWVASSGYAQTNTAAEITAQLASLKNFIENGVELYPVIYLHSNDGSTTPDIDNLYFEYSFKPSVIETYTICSVWGYLRDFAGFAINDKRPIFVQLNKNAVTYKNYTVVSGAPRKIMPKNGRFEIELLDTANMSDGADDNIYYIFTIKGQIYRKIVPAQNDANFWDLSDPNELNE